MEEKNTKQKIVSKAVWLKKRIDSFAKLVGPFLMIIALVITLPYIQAVSIRWLWALVILIIALDIALKGIEEAFERDIKVELLVKECDERIEELERRKVKLLKLKELENKKEVHIKL